MDINSNTIDGGGNTGICTSTAMALEVGTTAPAAPKGMVRNNILTGGACTLSATSGAIRSDFVEAATTTDPRLFQNNDLDSSGTPAATLYLDEGTTTKPTIQSVNGLTDTTVGGNINAPPMFMSFTGDLSTEDLRLKTGSACFGAGTTTGAPANDLLNMSRLGKIPTIGAYQ